MDDRKARLYRDGLEIFFVQGVSRMMSIDATIDRVALAIYDRPCSELTCLQRRELVKTLRSDGLHVEADALWSRVLRDSISQLAVHTRTR